MNEVYQINIIRKNNQTFTSISDAPIKDVYAMLYSAISLVSEKTNMPVKTTLSILADLDNFARETGQV